MVLLHSLLAMCLLIPSLAFAVDAPPQTDTQTQTGFVPLTHFPQITALSNSAGFGDFVNQLYKILIGAGAVIAVIMIMVAGVQFMTSRGSVTSNEKAKSRIQNAILGLILILAPTIVFGIINPQILRIDIGSEFSGLKQGAINQNAFTSTSKTPSNNSTNAYLLAAYVVFTNNSTNSSCYTSLVQSYPTQSACSSAQNAAQAAFGQKDGWSRSDVTFVKSCELGEASTLSLTAPNGVSRCTN